MTQIIATPAELFELARKRKPCVAIVLPHAYEAVKSLRKLGVEYQFLKAAPSIAGKLAIVSLNGDIATEEDFALFSSLSPACGMKDGRIVNTTGHVLPFADDEVNEPAAAEPVDTVIDGYTLQRAGNEWYYYVNDGSLEQGAVLAYIYELVALATKFKGDISK
jgi:hypothetical protein